MAMKSDPLTGREADDPYPQAIALREQR